MADIELQRTHGLGLEGAREAADRMATQLGRKFDLKGDWAGNVLRFERPGVSGSLTITEKDLRLSVALGFLLKAMKPSIERAVTHELDALFPPGGGSTRVAAAEKGPGKAAAKPAVKAKKPAASRKKGA
jgi:putative polyhydroxyalkanoate system protein